MGCGLSLLRSVVPVMTAANPEMDVRESAVALEITEGAVKVRLTAWDGDQHSWVSFGVTSLPVTKTRGLKGAAI